MLSGCVGLRRSRVRTVAGLIGVVAVAATIASSPAEARKRRHAGGGGYTPPYAAMVVDAKTGRTLHAVNEDAARIPASLTKVMTLYLLFEQMERGRFAMDSELKVSSYAASQPPTKLGLRAGSTIAVEDGAGLQVQQQLPAHLPACERMGRAFHRRLRQRPSGRLPAACSRSPRRSRRRPRG